MQMLFVTPPLSHFVLFWQETKRQLSSPAAKAADTRDMPQLLTVAKSSILTLISHFLSNGG